MTGISKDQSIKFVGIDLAKLVEGADGFHPSQEAMGEIPPIIMEDLDANIFGTINPLNAEITALFGNQGGD